MSYTTEQLIGRIYATADQYGINRAVAYHQLKRESANFRRDVVYGNTRGGSGEVGIAQFMPGTWARFSNEPHIAGFDPDKSLDAWGKYMNFLLRKFGGRYDLALAGYNGGENRTCLEAGNIHCTQARTQNYVREILAAAGQSAPNAATVASDGSNTITGNGDHSGGFDWDELKGYAPYIIGGVIVLWLLSD